MTDEEREFILVTSDQLSATAIAKKLGRSVPFVTKHMRELGLEVGAFGKRKQPAPVEPPQPLRLVPPASEPDRLERLVELRGILHRQMLDAEPKSVAAISREYRATMDEIDRLQGGSGSGRSALDELIASIS